MSFFRRKSGGRKRRPTASYSMQVYHGTEVYFDKPDTKHSRGRTDFGNGLYTASDEGYARYHMEEIRKVKNYVIIEYEFDDEAAVADGLRIIRFNKDTEWAKFIMANRTDNKLAIKKWGDFDVAIGPSADDTINAVVEYYLECVARGSVDWDEIVNRLEPDKYGEQILFHTERSVSSRYLKETRNEAS